MIKSLMQYTEPRFARLVPATKRLARLARHPAQIVTAPQVEVFELWQLQQAREVEVAGP